MELVSTIKASAKPQKPTEGKDHIQQEGQRFEKFPELWPDHWRKFMDGWAAASKQDSSSQRARNYLEWNQNDQRGQTARQRGRERGVGGTMLVLDVQVHKWQDLTLVICASRVNEAEAAKGRAQREEPTLGH